MNIWIIGALTLFLVFRVWDIITTVYLMKCAKGTELNAVIGNSKQKYYRLLLHGVILFEILLIIAQLSPDAFYFATGFFTGQAAVGAGINMRGIAVHLRRLEALAREHFVAALGKWQRFGELFYSKEEPIQDKS